MSDGTLYYFPVPGTPGEVVRLTLQLGGFDWKVQHIHVSLFMRKSACVKG